MPLKDYTNLLDTRYKNGLEIFSGARVSARQHDEVFLLTFNDLKDADSGEYTCEASNKNGTEKCKAKLVVHSKL